ncbi:uncharacterized protein PV06_09415 [Exophiala oligosperma]|uniref:Transcription factor domain-containing protein n=1 Tax=Exophiala oligosperma TaxID=215243 RepID=A0A0D2DS03_9EURO|nr:uncharacterized protein PV06_09415 [Exophiala oligosperma]KIW38454.1 hypothetical protein PV06_09415 [Exophiala oligosperma]
MAGPTSTALIHIKKESVVVEAEDLQPHEQRDESDKGKEEKFRELSTRQKLLAIVRYSVKPFSDRLDPFAALPVNLDRLQEHLVSFYLLYYPKATYGFSSRLRPHPVASNFSIALTTPACFQVILARSALYRIGLNKYASEREKDELNMAVMRHKGEALKMLRVLSTKASPNRKDDLLASIISLGTFDRRTGAKDAAGMHYSTVRRILKSTGGPLAVGSVLLSRVMCFFECIYGTSPESYIWDESDLDRLVKGLNGFLFGLWELWKSLSTISGLTAVTSKTAGPPRIHSFGLQLDSSLLSLVERRPPLDAELTQQGRLEMIFQVTCLLTFGMVTLDKAGDFRSLQEYMDGVHKQVDDLHLTGQSCNNVMWQIQVNDHSAEHSKRIWKAASYAWVLKHVSYNVQVSVKEWLLAFFKGEPVTEKQFRLDPFHFSYAN